MSAAPTQAPAQRVRLLIVDDHAVFRHGLQLALDQVDDLVVVGVCEDGAAGVHATRELAPDVVLMDVRMPGMTGIEAARLIGEQHPHARVVMLTASQNEGDLFSAIRAGASGYLLKEA